MANRWTIQDPVPKSERNNWAFPSDRDQHITDTVAVDDLDVNPEDIDVMVTKAPTESGIQSGEWKWDSTNVPDTTWYSWGSIAED